MELKRSYEDLIDNENNLHGDSHLGVVRYFLFKPLLSEWKCITIFYILATSRDTLLKTVIDGRSTIHLVAPSTIKRRNLKVEPHPYLFKVTCSFD